MQPPETASLLDLSRRSGATERNIATAEHSLRLADFPAATSLGVRRDALAGRSVLILVDDQLQAAAALLELDDVARRLVICPPFYLSVVLLCTGSNLVFLARSWSRPR